MHLIRVAAGLLLAFAVPAMAAEPVVRAWQASMTLPAWEEPLPDPIPQFSTGMYPYAARTASGKAARSESWRTLNLENEFLVCVVLPDLGGRLYSCRDKISGFEMFSPNAAAPKSAPGVAMTFPAAGRPVAPVDFRIVQRADIASVFVGATDRVTGMRWRVEYVLERGAAVLRQTVRVDNPTAVRRGYSWWTTANLSADDETTVVLPAGAAFAGAYHPRTQQGTLHYADPAELPERKVRRDAAGVELQAGAFAGPEPAGFLDPGASRTVNEFWLPLRKLPGVSFARRDGALYLKRKGGTLDAELLPARTIPNAKIRILCAGKPMAEEIVALDPATPWTRSVAGAPAGACRFELLDGAGQPLLVYIESEPRPAEAGKTTAEPPAGTLESGAYFEREGDLRRAAESLRAAFSKAPANPEVRMAAGRVAVAMQRYEEAAAMLSSAADAEGHYYRGVALSRLGADEDARREWSESRADAQFGIASAIETAAAMARAGDTQRAASELSGAGVRTARALVMQAAMARASGDAAAARVSITQAAALDPADSTVRFELVRQGAADPALWEHLAADPERVLEIADLYLNWGRPKDALEVLMYRYPPVSGTRREPGAAAPEDYALLAYYRGYCHRKLNEYATEDFRAGSALPVRYVFPSRPLERRILEAALEANATDANAHYLLGLWFLNAQLTPDGTRELQGAQRLKPDMQEARDLLARLNGPAVTRAAPKPAAPAAAPPKPAATPKPVPAPPPAPTPPPVEVPRPVPTPAPPSTPDNDSAALAGVPGWNAGKPADLAAKALDAANAGDIDRAFTYFHRANMPGSKQPNFVRWAYLEIQLQRIFEQAYAGKCDDVPRGLGTLGADDKSLPFTSSGFADLMKGARFQFEVGLLEIACISEKEAKKRWEKVSKLRPPVNSPDFTYPYLALSKLGPMSGLEIVLQQILDAMKTAPAADQPALLYSQGLVFWALGKKAEAGAAFHQGETKAPAGMLRYLNQNALRALARAKE